MTLTVSMPACSVQFIITRNVPGNALPLVIPFSDTFKFYNPE
jgi:hypothetical protein